MATSRQAFRPTAAEFHSVKTRRQLCGSRATYRQSGAIFDHSGAMQMCDSVLIFPTPDRLIMQDHKLYLYEVPAWWLTCVL